MRRMIAGLFLLVGSAGIGASPFAAVATDCDGAEVVGLIQVDGPHSSPLSFRKSGSLQPEEVTFLSFDADPDRILSVRYAGEEDAQVLLGIFDSRCQLLSWSVTRRQILAMECQFELYGRDDGTSDAA